MKNKFRYTGIIAVLIGFALNRVLVSIYGDSGRIMLASAALTLFLICWLAMIFAKAYVVAIGTSFVGVPAIVMTVGVILDNAIMVFGGLVLFMVGIVILLKIAPKAIEKQKEKQKEKIE